MLGEILAFADTGTYKEGVRDEWLSLGLRPGTSNRSRQGGDLVHNLVHTSIKNGRNPSHLAKG